MNQLLLIGDPHFKTDTLHESHVFTNSIESILQNIHPSLHAVVIMGDILHTHEKIHTSALNSALTFISMCKKYVPLVVCLVGNHDAINNSIFCTDSHWMNVLKGQEGILVVDKPIIQTFNDCKVVFCPYVSDGRFVEALNQLDDWKTVDLICGHQLLDGAKMGPIIAEGVESWDESWPLVISGHIHDKQRVQENLYYCGSSMQHAFGDSHDKTICLFSTDTLSFEEIIPPNIKKKEILYFEAHQVSEIKQVCLQNCNKIYKIVIKGDEGDCKALKKTNIMKELKSCPNVKSVQFKETQKVLEDFKANDDELTLGFVDHLYSIVEKRADRDVKQYIDKLLQRCVN
jgi:DNA repair exonuclease SbcCD nuclease subunit